MKRKKTSTYQNHNGEIKIPVTFEDDTGRELPSPSLLFRPLRQMLYALLFNQHHLQYLAEQKKEKEGIEEKVPDIVIKEWVWSKSNKYNKPDCVPSMPLGWPVPTVTRLWFGSGPDDNKKRLQAFLTLNESYDLAHRSFFGCFFPASETFDLTYWLSTHLSVHFISDYYGSD
ncbi:constitutive coactivator of PPAR-gamma-like protein 1 [Trichonephila clavipes]|nr:constitutive coactivator of PPAR-gamma-like protein 1 [Trichonephila clavipes]